MVSEKFTDKRMVSQQFDYDLVEKWAVRMSNNGEFIHANPDTTGVQGSSNVTHGCINLSTDNAKAYYDTAHLRRPGGGHRHAGQARVARRRHLGLDAVVGPVEGPLSPRERPPGVPSGPGGYGPVMSTPDDGPRSDLGEQVATRAEPLPEEVAAGDVGDRRAEAAEILRDSEERVAEAVEGNAPGDAADEHRPSDEGV